jgi:hypothetical protein
MWFIVQSAEVVWENVRILKNSGETVSVDGTHLGHNVSWIDATQYVRIVPNFKLTFWRFSFETHSFQTERGIDIVSILWALPEGHQKLAVSADGLALWIIDR